MNKKIIIFSILIGISLASFLYFKYRNNKEYEIKIYFVQIGAYKNIDNVSKITKTLDSYVVINENDINYIYIGITKEKENAKKISNLYNSESYIKEKNILISKNTNLDYIENYEKIIKNTDDIYIIKEINKEMINKYKEVVL